MVSLQCAGRQQYPSVCGLPLDKSTDSTSVIPSDPYGHAAVRGRYARTKLPGGSRCGVIHEGEVGDVPYRVCLGVELYL